MEDEFVKFSKMKADYEKKREETYKRDSKDRLAKILKTKVKTTMIGALSSFEEKMGFLWGRGLDDLTPEQKAIHELYMEARSEILDKGNTQSRNIDSELAHYDIEWKRHSVILPVKPTRS